MVERTEVSWAISSGHTVVTLEVTQAEPFCLESEKPNPEMFQVLAKRKCFHCALKWHPWRGLSGILSECIFLAQLGISVALEQHCAASSFSRLSMSPEWSALWWSRILAFITSINFLPPPPPLHLLLSYHWGRIWYPLFCFAFLCMSLKSIHMSICGALVVNCHDISGFILGKIYSLCLRVPLLKAAAVCLDILLV